MTSIHRSRKILNAVGRAYEDAWLVARNLRARRGSTTLPDWPNWCYLPLHGAYAIVSDGDQVPFERTHHIGAVGALVAWRITQGVYRYDPALFPALRSTSIVGDLPIDPLYRLPEWCVYIETPDMTWGDRPLYGVWAHLDWSTHGADELRLLLDTAEDADNPLDAESGLIPIPLILGAGRLATALDLVVESSQRQALLHGYGPQASELDAKALARQIAPIVSLVLYLCASNADIVTASGRSAKPSPTHTEGTDPSMAADRVTIWDVGSRIGARVRSTYHAYQTGAGVMSIAQYVRPHVRQAHWHTFLAGAGRKERRVRWVPPVAVNVTGAD